MNPTQTRWTPLPPLEIDWQNGVPVARQSGDVFFSTEDGVAESDYVFIQGNQLRERWAAHTCDQPFVIAEVGLGTGLNTCLTIAEWLKHRPIGATLHYLGFEKAPVRPDDMRRALSHWPELEPIITTLLERWPDPLLGCQRRHFPQWGLTLDLWWGDAGDALEDLAGHGKQWVDAWYLDGFAPAREPGPWHPALYDAMSSLSRPSATFATFTAAGDVRRGLVAAGFEVSKREGFGGKREALCGRILQPRPVAPPMTPWDLNPGPRVPTHVVVLGAGLAGAHAAFTLASRGIPVTVLESGAMAAAGSGNLQGVTYTRLSHQHNPLTDFSLAGYGYATDHYQRLVASSVLKEGLDIGLGGYIQLHDSDDTLEHLAAVLPLAPDFARVVSATEIAGQIGLEPRCGGIHYLRWGWLNPQAVCRALLDHPLISLREQCGNLLLQPSPDGLWQAQAQDGRCVAEAPAAIVSTAQHVTQQAGLEWLPLNIIRGQTTHLPSSSQLNVLPIAVCDQGYLPPARDGIHCMGASFGPGDIGTDERQSEHAHNVEMMCTALPDLHLTAPKGGWRGQIAHRCNSNDYLPVAGMAPDLNAFNTCYERLRHDRKRVIDAPCPLQPGLAVLTSLGSRGLSAAPLAAQVLIDQMLGTPPAVPRYLQRAISPARFAERALKRGEPL